MAAATNRAHRALVFVGSSIGISTEEPQPSSRKRTRISATSLKAASQKAKKAPKTIVVVGALIAAPIAALRAGSGTDSS